MTEADSAARRSPTRQKFRLKRFLPKSLFGRALLIIVMPLILLQVVTTWIFFDRHWDVVSRRLASGVAGEVSATITLLRDIPAETGERQALLDGLSPAFNLDLGFAPGAVLPNTRPRDAAWLSDDSLERALKDQVRRPFHIHSSGFNAPREVRVQLADGVLTVVVPEKRLFTATTVLFVVWMVGSSMVLFAVAGLFMSNQVRPIRRLADAAEAFGKGRDPGDFQVRGATEVRQAAMAFKLMRERIMRQVGQRTAMLAGVSHDLRTPITRMKLQLAMLPPGDDVEELKSDLDEMERMLEGYLAFARGEGAERAEPTSINAVLKDVVAQARREGGSIDLRLDGDIDLPLRVGAFRRCLGNLVGNALRYASHARVTAKRNGSLLEILVDDDGPGIPEHMRSEVFRPFFRLEQSRNAETGGTGLGLSIARDVAHLHGGDLALDASPLGGLRARLTLPI